MSAFDAVDGSSTGTGVPWMWVPIRPHDSEEPSHASDYDHRSRHCEVGFPGSRRRCEDACDAPHNSSLTMCLEQAQKAMARLRQIDPELRISNLRDLTPLRRPENMA